MQFIKSPTEVADWLENISMREHTKDFLEAGYLDLQAILMLEEIDLLAMGIEPSHRLVIQSAIQRLRSPMVKFSLPSPSLLINLPKTNRKGVSTLNSLKNHLPVLLLETQPHVEKTKMYA